MAKILVIDDIEYLRDTISEILRRGGYDTVRAANWRAGLAMFKEYAPDLVVTDVLMPDLEGLDTIRSLKALSPNLPIIAISGSTDSPHLQTAIELGATETLRKPFKQEDLLSAVRRNVQSA
ncbi:response regulator [bacterium]|nr:response regulator [bacterium]